MRYFQTIHSVIIVIRAWAVREIRGVRFYVENAVLCHLFTKGVLGTRLLKIDFHG